MGETKEFLKYIMTVSNSNRDEMSFWLPRVQDCGIRVPETAIFRLSEDQVFWLLNERYKEDQIKEMNDYILALLEEIGFKHKGRLFMKSGLFSNKFSFSDSCLVDDRSKIGSQYINIFQAQAAVGCDISTELVLREYIEPEPNTPTIYSGMPLRTEFRVFYDFGAKKVIDCFSYWDRETMLEHLNGEDLETFKANIDSLEREFEENRESVIALVDDAMKSVTDLVVDRWSIDIMKSGDKYYLTDMAMAFNSYYYDRIVKKEREGQ